MDAIARGRGAAKQMYAVIDRRPVIDARDPSGEQPATCEGELALRGVHFAYPSRPEACIFAGLTLALPAGRTTALVGESGCGKSTIIQLVVRFYDPDGGGVYLDGRDLRTLNVAWLRRVVGLVSQEPVLFAASVAENLRVGNPDATQAQLEAACVAAHAHDFIVAMASGYDTPVGERGAQLSGGQKQRVAIARALLRDPKVLLLDEATSALDTESERAVQAALDSVQVGRTTVAIAHRLSTIRDAHSIAVLRRGELVEQGTHEELVALRGGAYATLLAMQERSPAAPAAAPAAAAPAGAAEVAHEPVAADVPAAAAPAADGKDKTAAGDDAPEETVPFWRLAQLSRPEAPWFAVGSLAACAAGCLFPVFALILSRLLDVFYQPPGPRMERGAILWSMLFFALGGGMLCITTTQQTAAGVVGQRCVHRVRTHALAAALRQEVAFFDDQRNSSGALAGRLAGDAAVLRVLVADGVFAVATSIASLVAGMVIAFIGGWQLTLVMLGVMPLIMASYYFTVQRMMGLSGDSRALYEGATQVAADAVGNVRTVAAFGAQDAVLLRDDASLRAPLAAAVHGAELGGLTQGFSAMVATLPPAFAFYIGGIFIVHGYMTFQDVMQVFFAILMAAAGMGMISTVSGDIAAARPAAAALFQMLDRRPAIDSADAGGLQPASCAGDVELREVAFAYPSRPERPVLHCLSLRAPAGRTLALVGESGCGKSTVVALLERFYDPSGGAIYLDGNDLRQLNVGWLRRRLGLVSQEPTLFDCSIAENIALGAPDDAKLSAQDIEAAARTANAHGFISALPAGYDTRVGERGAQLSGGQKQRVAIARALLRDPKVLLLDEATSALDAESERAVQAALERLQAGRTCIVVAHRLSTVRDAHSIAVLRKGEVIEQGTHEELVAKRGGAYAQLMAVRSE